jgi:hypothetical protein
VPTVQLHANMQAAHCSRSLAVDTKTRLHPSFYRLRWGIGAFLIMILANVVTCCE